MGYSTPKEVCFPPRTASPKYITGSTGPLLIVRSRQNAHSGQGGVRKSRTGGGVYKVCTFALLTPACAPARTAFATAAAKG